MPKQRLELTWIGKDKRPDLEPRILLEDAEKSYHAPHRVTQNAPLNEYEQHIMVDVILLQAKFN